MSRLQEDWEHFASQIEIPLALTVHFPPALACLQDFDGTPPLRSAMVPKKLLVTGCIEGSSLKRSKAGQEVVWGGEKVEPGEMR